MSVNSLTAALTPSAVVVKNGSQFSLEFALTNTNIKQDPIVLTAEADYTDEYGVAQVATAQSVPIDVDRSVLVTVVKLPLPAYVAYVAGSAQWNGIALDSDAVLDAGVLTAVVNATLVEVGVGKFTASFMLA